MVHIMLAKPKVTRTGTFPGRPWRVLLVWESRQVATFTDHPSHEAACLWLRTLNLSWPYEVKAPTS